MKKCLDGVDADLYLYGHIHAPIYNKYKNKTYINPGATGCPGKTNLAPYGILEIDKGEIKYDQLYASYNVDEVISEIKRIAFPAYEHVLKVFYGIE